MNQLIQIANEIGQALLARGWKLATAESCTGGWVAQAVTAIAGSSAWFDRGFVTYSNLAKEQMLGVKETTLTRFGAVSEQTAREMVEGALRHSQADIALSITGIAGPEGGTADKPVGLVWFGWAGRTLSTQADYQAFAGNREEIRYQAAAYSMSGLLERIALKEARK